MTEQPLTGSMPLYERPELLTREDHGHLGLRTLPQPFSFARDATAVPLMVSEFRSAQRHCPVIFTSADEPLPMAVLGLPDGPNLLVDDDGQWQVPGYVPAYLRCYPFALASAATDRYTLVVDRTADMVSDAPDVPFFEDGELSKPVQERLELCRAYQTERQRTELFCEKLKRLDLLSQQQAHHTVDGRNVPLAQYFTIDRDKLTALDDATIAELLRDGSLAAMIAQIFSLDNFVEFVHLAQRRGAR